MESANRNTFTVRNRPSRLRLPTNTPLIELEISCSKMPVARKAYIILATLLLGTVLVLLVMAIRYNQVFTATTEWVRHTIVVLGVDQQALTDLHDYETGTTDTKALKDHIRQLQQLTADNPSQQAKARKLLDLSTLLPVKRTGGEAAANPHTDSMRTLLLRFQMEENALLNSREAVSTQSRRLLKTAIITLLGLLLTLLVTGSYVILYNFNRRIKAEKKWQESEGLAGALINNVKDYAIIMLDAQGKVLSWNLGAQHLKGHTREEIIGRPISLFYTDEENARGEPTFNLQKAVQEGRYECTGLRKRKDGSVFYADVVFTTLRNKQGELAGFIKITKDITAQIAAQEEQNKALVREKELNELKSRFVTIASHEFKTPLSVILSSTNLAEKYHSPETADKRLRHLQRIKSNAINLKRLLSDFLSLEKLEAGVVRNEPETSDLLKMAEEAIEDMEETCKDRQHIEFEVKGIPRPVAIDQQLLRNILNNLLSNAIKYSPEQSLIRFVLEFENDTVRFLVTDSGIGIPLDEQEHLFERFFRARNTSGVSGTGLGLSIVKRYLDLMGGAISVKSAPGEGTTFTIVLPAVTDHQKEARLLHNLL